MPALSDSGQLPAVRSLPVPSSSSSRFGTSALRRVQSQHLKVSMLSLTDFGLPGHQYSITNASREEWLLFCNQCHVSTINYSENSDFSDLTRRDFANAQMFTGCMALCHDPRAESRFLLVPARVVMPMCIDLAMEGRWDIALCCPACHEEQDFRKIFLAGDDPFRGIDGRGYVQGCCRCEHLLLGYHPGRVFSQEQLNTHIDVDECTDDDNIFERA